MPKSLIITEKPSVARDIVEALGGFTDNDGEFWENDQYLCTFAVGHILELLEPEEVDPVYKRWTFDNLPIIPDEFKLKPKSGQNDRLRTIKKLINRDDVDSVINACDAGREGELIFREVVKFLGSTKPLRRLWLQSMTQQAIRTGFTKLEDGRKFEGLAAAAECRSLADWLIGMNATRAMTIRLRSKAHKGAWSAGRVQTPTLSLLVERELEVLSHIPVPYWRVLANFSAADHEYTSNWFDPNFKEVEEKPHAKADRIFDKAEAERITALVAGKPGIASETRKPSREAAPVLFDLTSLQREANRKFSWSAARTLQAAQRCYEQHKALTYPRTSSRCLPNDYVTHVETVTQTLAATPEYSSPARFLIRNGRQNDGKVFNDAGVSDHFAIIPTGVIPSSISGDDAKLFDLVVRRFLAAFHPPAVWEQVDRKTVVEGQNFSSRARTLKEPGWRAAYDQDAQDSDSKGLPALISGQDKSDDVAVKNKTSEVENDETRPPPRITEARLLSLMENAGKQIEDEDIAAAMQDKGLGTPATRADIIENLKAKDYVDKTLRPTAKGMRFIDMLRRIHADRLTSAELTGELELHLAQVEHGERNSIAFMDEIKTYTADVVDKVRNFEYDKIFPNEKPLGICPCGRGRKVYERAWFYRCEEDPAEVEAGTDCQFRIWKDKSGRYIDRQTVEILLRDGKTGELDGFRDRQGRTYKAILAIENLDIVMKPVAGSERQEEGMAPAITLEVNPEPLGPCPTCGEGCEVIETPTDFVCQTRLKELEAGERKPKGVILPRIVCKRIIERNEAIEFFKTGETPLIEDFISRFGRPFKAKLKLQPTGKHGFEFPPREPGAGRGGRFKKKVAAGAEGEAEAAENGEAPVKKKAAAKKKTAVAKKKTTRKKAVKKASS